MYCIKLVNVDPARLSKVKWLMDQGIVNKNVWLAGGSLRTLIDPKETVSDYDLFFKIQYDNPFYAKLSDPSDWDLVRETRNKLINLGFKLTFECPEGKLYTYTGKNSYGEIKVQLICEHFYSSPEELLSTFDLTPCLFATNGTFLYVYKSGIKSVKRKIAELHRLTYPVSSIKRLIKYANKGYNVNAAIISIVDNLIRRTDILATDYGRIYID